MLVTSEEKKDDLAKQFEEAKKVAKMAKNFHETVGGNNSEFEHLQTNFWSRFSRVIRVVRYCTVASLSVKFRSLRKSTRDHFMIIFRFLQ